MDDEGTDTFDFDIAVSFANEDRSLVSDIVERVKQLGYRVFYDADAGADLWGEDLAEYFDNVYRKRSRFALIFVSHNYASKMWTRHERRSVLARALEQQSTYVLPVRLDDTELDGLRPTIGYLDARRVGFDEIVTAVDKKLNSSLQPRTRSLIEQVPHSQTESQQLLVERPPGWEHLYFAGCLRQFREEAEAKYFDHQIRYANPSGRYVSEDSVLGFLHEMLDAALALTTSLNRVMDDATQAKVLRGADAEPEKIRHLALRWNDHYERLMDWASSIRGTVVASRFENLLEAYARVVDDPIECYRRLTIEYEKALVDAPARLRRGENITLELTYTLRIPDEVSSQLSFELARLSDQDEDA